MDAKRIQALAQFVTVGNTIEGMHDGTPMWTIMGISLTWGDVRQLVEIAENEVLSRLDPIALALVSEEPESFTCPRCGRTSYNPGDVADGYCGACHQRTAGWAIGNHD